jgi:hypothetical protein
MKPKSVGYTTLKNGSHAVVIMHKTPNKLVKAKPEIIKDYAKSWNAKRGAERAAKRLGYAYVGRVFLLDKKP